MSLLTLLEAANFLESAEKAAAVPRDAIGTSSPQASPVLLTPFQDTADKDDGSPVNISSQSLNADVQAVRRSGGAGTREVHNKLEKYRRAHLKECFTNLRKYINVPDSRKLSNLSILRFAIRHIRFLNENYSQLSKMLSKEKVEQMTLKNILRHNSNVEIPAVLENLVVPGISSPSTDTASDENDEDNIETSAAKDTSSSSVLLSPNPVPTVCADMTSTANPSNIILLCPALPQKVTQVQGPVIVPASTHSILHPIKPATSLPSRLAPTSAVLPGHIPASHLAISQIDSLVMLSPGTPEVSQNSEPSVTKEGSRTASMLKNSSATLVIPQTSSEVAPAPLLQGNSRPVVQMLQQTITQRAIVQQEKQRQLLTQNQQTASQRGIASTALKKVALLQPATLTLTPTNSQAISSLASSSSLRFTPVIASSSTSAVLQLKSPVLQTSPSFSVANLNKSSLSSGLKSPQTSTADMPIVTAVAQQSVAVTSLPESTLLGGSSITGSSLVTSPMFLQLMSQNQLGTLQVRPLDDLSHLGGGHLVAIYPVMSPIPLTQFLTPVTVTPSTIPISNTDSICCQQDVVSLLQAASNQAKLIEHDIVTPSSC